MVTFKYRYVLLYVFSTQHHYPVFCSCSELSSVTRGVDFRSSRYGYRVRPPVEDLPLAASPAKTSGPCDCIIRAPASPQRRSQIISNAGLFNGRNESNHSDFRYGLPGMYRYGHYVTSPNYCSGPWSRGNCEAVER